MRGFFSKYSFVFIWVGAIALTGWFFSYVVQSNLHLTSLTPSGESQYRVTPPPPPPAPPAPSVSLTIVKTKNGNSLYVQWSNLPADTAALDIYRGLNTAPSSTWSLYKSLQIAAADLANGHASIDIGKTTLSGFAFFIQAVNAGGNPSGNGSSTGAFGNSSSTVLFTSLVIIPDVATSTPGSTPPPSQNNNPPPGTGTPPPSNPSTTQQNPPGTPPPSNPSTTQQNPLGTPGQTPTGTPYYNPQIQISGYGADQTGNFYVQYVDQKIQFGWQNLPVGTTEIRISRSATSTGPWSSVLSQINPVIGAPDSIQLVDNSFGTPFYYEMEVIAETSTTATYGPVYLAPTAQ